MSASGRAVARKVPIQNRSLELPFLGGNARALTKKGKKEIPFDLPCPCDSLYRKLPLPQFRLKISTFCFETMRYENLGDLTPDFLIQRADPESLVFGGGVNVY